MNVELLLWLPIVLLALASVIKMLSSSDGNNRKPWIRIEEINENE
jgi:hypothetical protein|tara:strand:- start:405 stop:539 length:135 start_codon:yes stop_codon:yes gene_type:complete